MRAARSARPKARRSASAPEMSVRAERARKRSADSSSVSVSARSTRRWTRALAGPKSPILIPTHRNPPRWGSAYSRARDRLRARPRPGGVPDRRRLHGARDRALGARSDRHDRHRRLDRRPRLAFAVVSILALEQVLPNLERALF